MDGLPGVDWGCANGLLLFEGPPNVKLGPEVVVGVALNENEPVVEGRVSPSGAFGPNPNAVVGDWPKLLNVIDGLSSTFASGFANGLVVGPPKAKGEEVVAGLGCPNVDELGTEGHLRSPTWIFPTDLSG